MIITNWLARAEGSEGLVFPNEFTVKKTRIYGKVYGHPDFQDGEHVQTGIVTEYRGGKITTISGEEFILKDQQKVYSKYLSARYEGLTVLKEWKVVDGRLVGKGLDGKEKSGRVVGQNFKENICRFEDGRLVFVDWLSKARDYIPKHGMGDFLVFGIERCMPDIFGKHFRMFKKN